MTYFIAIDSWIALEGLSHPLESDQMAQIRPWLVLGKLLGTLAAFIAAASLVLGIECLRSLKGMRFALAAVRSMGDVTGLLLFFGPILFGVAVLYCTLIGTDSDLLVRPEDEHYQSLGRTLLQVLDALLGNQESVGAFWNVRSQQSKIYDRTSFLSLIACAYSFTDPQSGAAAGRSRVFISSSRSSRRSSWQTCSLPSSATPGSSPCSTPRPGAGLARRALHQLWPTPPLRRPRGERPAQMARL